MMRLVRSALVAVAVLAWPAAAGASLPQQLGSVGFDASVNRVLTGPTGQDLRVGRPVYIGDVNGDGIGDFAVGVPFAQNASGAITGAVYVVFGQSSIQGGPLTSANGFVIYGGANGDQFGASVAAAGDINGDGKADLVVGAPGQSSGAGAAYVVYGKSSTAPVSDTDTDFQGYVIYGAGASAKLGTSVSGIADINGDGVPDVVIGAPGDAVNGTNSGAVFVVNGRSTPAAVGLNTLATIVGGGAYEVANSAAGGWSAYYGGAGQQFGLSVAGLGDFNGAGKPDLAFGGYSGASNATRTLFVAFPDDTTHSLTLTQPAGATSDLAASVASAGDINGDGFADLVVGDSEASGSPGGSEQGAAYVLFGGHTTGPLLTTELAATADGFAITGHAAAENLGSFVGGVGDINGDGLADIAVGGDGAGPNSRGEALIVFGSAQRNPATDPVSAGVTITSAQVVNGGGFGFGVVGTHNGDEVGAGIGGGGDVTADGRADVLVGAAAYNAGDGAVAVVRGFGQPAFSYAPVHGQVGVPLTVTPTVTARTGTPTFAPSGALPAGLSLDPATGTISGTPTTAGTSTGLITMTDDASQTLASVPIDIAPAGTGGPGECPAGETGTPPNCHTIQGPPPGIGCTVPRLHGKTPAAARRALAHAHCAAGNVRRPRHHARPPTGFKLVLVVTKQALRPGTNDPAGTKVNLTLGYKRIRVRKHRH